MQIKSYKELTAYIRSYETVKIVYQMTQRFPKEEMYGIVSQMRRAAVSVPSNIAEGYMRGHNEYVQFLKIALGSCAELETQLSLSKDLQFCGSDDFKRAYELNTEVIKLLKTYLSKLNTKRYTLTAIR